MALTGNTTAEWIWDFLISSGLSAAGAAGLMGNLYAESGLEPKNLQNSCESRLGYSDESYTAAIDNGEYAVERFASDSAGYGLAQWTYKTRKKALYEYARESGGSIGDLKVQLMFLRKEMKEDYPGVWAKLESASTVRAASDTVLTRYEKPADQSEGVKTRRAQYGQVYYDMYA